MRCDDDQLPWAEVERRYLQRQERDLARLGILPACLPSPDALSPDPADNWRDELPAARPVRHGTRARQRAAQRVSRKRRDDRVTLRVEEVARERGYVNAKGVGKGKVNIAALMRATGLAKSVVWALVRSPASATAIHLDTLARLCDALGCQPADLLAFDSSRMGPRGPLVRLPLR